MVEETSGDALADGSWLTVAAAARRLGVSPRAVRGRIKRGTIEWRAVGNTGKLVLVRPGDASADDLGDDRDDELDQLREELMETREHLAGTKTALEAAVAIRKAKVGALRKLADRLTAELAEARRPWWRRWFGS